MAALDKILHNKFFSIRNLLLFVTLTLMVIVISLTWLRMDVALDNSARAERSMDVNKLIDNIVEMKLALSDERSATYTSYGSPQPTSADFTKIIKNSRRAIEGAYSTIIATIDEIEPFDGEDVNEAIYAAVTSRFEDSKKKLREAYAKYEGQLDTIDQDLGKMEDGRELNGRSATNVMTDLVEAAAKVRLALEENYDFGDDRISQVIRLKHQLWLMIEYATRESASLGENVASGEQISSIKRDQGSRYGGYGQAAWSQVMGVANSVSFASEDTTPESRDAQIEAIQKAFFNDFELTRFDLYDLSDEAEPNDDGNIVVDYDITPIDWVRLAETAAEPVMKMNAYAKNLSAHLNEGCDVQGGTPCECALRHHDGALERQP